MQLELYPIRGRRATPKIPSIDNVIDLADSIQGTFVMGFNRFSGKPLSDSVDRWLAFAEDHRQTANLAADTPTLHLQLIDCSSFSFSLLLGTNEVLTW